MVAQGCKAVGLVEEMAEEARLNVEKVVAEGDPSSEIIRLSSEMEVDVLVIASSGKGGMEKLFMGSVAEKVIRGSKVPVMMVPTNRDHRP
jgi:nucleotide-binding universal stress UspA family protein